MRRDVLTLGSLLAALVLARAGAAHAQDDARIEPVQEGMEAPAEAEAIEVPPPVAASAEARIAVLMLPTGDVDGAMGDALTEFLISQVAARGDGIGIVGKEEFQAQLGQGDAGTVECVESAACLGRVGVQLSVIEVIAGTIGRRTSEDGALVWAFNLNRLDVRSGELLGRVFREVTGDLDALLHALEESFPELYARRVQPGRLVISATVAGATVELDGVTIGVFDGAPLRRETVEPGRHVLRVRAEGHRTYERTLDVEEAATVFVEAPLERGGAWTASPLVYVGAGVAALALAGGIGFAVASQAQPDASLSMRETIDAFYPSRQTEATVSTGLFVAAAAGAALGIVGLLLSGEETPDDAQADAPVSATFAPAPGGGVVSVAGRF